MVFHNHNLLLYVTEMQSSFFPWNTLVKLFPTNQNLCKCGLKKSNCVIISLKFGRFNVEELHWCSLCTGHRLAEGLFPTWGTKCQHRQREQWYHVLKTMSTETVTMQSWKTENLWWKELQICTKVNYRKFQRKHCSQNSFLSALSDSHHQIQDRWTSQV